MPKGWSVPEQELDVIKEKKDELAKVSDKIEKENAKLEEQEKIVQAIEKQKSKLTQLVLNREEYEQQV